MAIIEHLKATKFSADEAELAEITQKILHKIQHQGSDDYFNCEDYEKLLTHYFNANDEVGLKLMLSPTMINLLKKNPVGKYSLFESDRGQELENIQLRFFVGCIKKGETEKVKHLLNFSPYCKLNINKILTIGESGKMAPGASLLHLALICGNADVAKLLVENGADPDVMDYYESSILHSGARGGHATFEYAMQLRGASSKNIFGHTPDDYLNKKEQLSMISMSKLIDQFAKYMKINKYDENIIITREDGTTIKGSNVIKVVEGGVCYGDSFIRAINILRGSASVELHQKMDKIIRGWDETLEGLDKPLTDPALLEIFFNPLVPSKIPKVRDVFEYMMSIILTAHDDRLISVLDIARPLNRVEMFKLLTNKDDKLEQVDEIDRSITSKEELKTKLEKIVTLPSRYIDIDVSFKDLETGRTEYHAVCLLTGQNNSLMYIDPNTPYEFSALKNDSASLDKIIDIIFAYGNNVVNIKTYQYSNELSLMSKMSHAPK